jgi:hypothetical protein
MSALPRTNVVSGTVTHRRDHVPASKIVKRVALSLALIFVLFLAFGLTLNAMAGTLIPR